MTTPRSLVHQTLDFAGPRRVPRHLWTLPWADMKHPGSVAQIRAAYPDDIVAPNHVYRTPPRRHGEQYEIGTYVDEWGCVFTNYQRGVIGEVKEPLIKDPDWEDRTSLRLPVELLSLDTSVVNAFCRSSERFVMGGLSVNPFERLQWIRGSQELYLDLATRQPGMFEVLKQIHTFNCELLSLLVSTEIDAVSIFDDWGAQRGLLINPQMWVEVFKPLYKEYSGIAHSHGKRCFMHSDGHTLDILPHLIEIGIDAANLQIFCVGLEQLRPFRGKITFWGEIDRQHLLPYATTEQIVQAVAEVKDALWAGGGCIAQCEYGTGARPDNVSAVFETWDQLVR